MVELLIAVGVLLVAVLSAFSSQITSMNLMQTSRETATALADLQAAMEGALTIQTADLPANSDYLDGQPIPAFTNANLTNEQIVTTYPGYVAGNDVPDPLTIVMTLTFNDYGGRQRTMQLTSMKVR